MSFALKALLTLLTISYPFAVYFGLQQGYAAGLLLMMAALVALRWATTGSNDEKRLTLVIGLGLCLIVGIWGYQSGLKFYPVMVNLSLLAAFGSTLLYPPSMIERFARLTEPDLPDQAIAYTRKVTQVWCVFFIVNGTLAAITALWGSDTQWLLYNGVIAYVLMGVLGGVEWLVRQRVKRQHSRSQ